MAVGIGLCSVAEADGLKPCQDKGSLLAASGLALCVLPCGTSTSSITVLVSISGLVASWEIVVSRVLPLDDREAGEILLGRTEAITIGRFDTRTKDG